MRPRTPSWRSILECTKAFRLVALRVAMCGFVAWEIIPLLASSSVAGATERMLVSLLGNGEPMGAKRSSAEGILVGANTLPPRSGPDADRVQRDRLAVRLDSAIRAMPREIWN